MKRRAAVRGAAFLIRGQDFIFATGYGNMNEWAAKLISPEVAACVGPVWGLGSGTKNDPGPWEGELRNMWKPRRSRGYGSTGEI